MVLQTVCSPKDSAVSHPVRRHGAPETSRSVSSEMWTPEEHGQLAKLYDRWAEINIHMPGRTAEMCRSYWMLQFIPASTAPGLTASGKNEMNTVLHEPPSPGIDRARERWTEEEDRPWCSRCAKLVL